MRLVKNNKPECARRKNRWPMMGEFCRETKLLMGALTKLWRTLIVQRNIELRISFFKTFDTTTCCLFTASSQNSLWEWNQNKSMLQRKDFLEGLGGTVSAALDYGENEMNCYTSRLRGMELMGHWHAQRLMKTFQRSFQKDACGCLDSTLLCIFITRL